MRDEDKRQLFSALSIAISLGLTIVVNIGIGLFIGKYLDEKFGLYPWATVGGIILGMATGLWGVYKKVAKEYTKG